MINALMEKEGHDIVAHWYAKDKEHEGGKLIKVKIKAAWFKGVAQPVQNLLVNVDRAELETRYNYPYAPNDKIYFHNQWWLIADLEQEYRKANEKSLALAHIEVAEKYTKLRIVRGGDGL